MDCFISFASEDIKAASWLRDCLKRQGLEVFLASDSIPSGSLWRPYIKHAIKRCEVVVLLDSPHSRRSPWVQQEAGMAQASGSLLIPVSLDGEFHLLPGWLSGFQAISAKGASSDPSILESVSAKVSEQVGSSWAALHEQLRVPGTIGATVLRAIILDQFSGPEERFGAWSRQYDRYLHFYYEGTKIRSSISQGATLTFTGMVIERLATFISRSPADLTPTGLAALKRGELFVLASQHRELGGFGRLSSDFGARSGRSLHLDIRHTCWALRALLSIDTTHAVNDPCSRGRLSDRIRQGLRWLAVNACQRGEADRWCWTTAPLLSLIVDDRLLGEEEWQQYAAALKNVVQSDLEASFDSRLMSWTRGEEESIQTRVSIDNALYVLYCLKDSTAISPSLAAQCRAAAEALIARIAASGCGGLPLFPSAAPEVGPTAQFVEIIDHLNPAFDSTLSRQFIARELARLQLLAYSFSWHLSAALAVPSLCDAIVG